MLRPRVKICGLTRLRDIEALDGLVDYLGFIVAARRVSPRVLTAEKAGELASAVARSKPVLVAAGMGVAEAVRLAARHGLPVVQYHNTLRTVAELEQLLEEAEKAGVTAAPVLQWSPRGWIGLTPWEAARARRIGEAEYVLVDAVKGSRPVEPSGLKVPAKVLAEAVEALHAAGARAGVAGGIRPGNVCRAACTGADLVDASSGVEAEPGAKDLRLVEQLLVELAGCCGGG